MNLSNQPTHVVFGDGQEDDSENGLTPREKHTAAGRSDLLFLSLSLFYYFFLISQQERRREHWPAPRFFTGMNEEAREGLPAAGADLCWLTEFGFGLKVAAGCLCAFLLLLTSELAPLSTSVSRAAPGEETQEARSAVWLSKVRAGDEEQGGITLAAFPPV